MSTWTSWSESNRNSCSVPNEYRIWLLIFCSAWKAIFWNSAKRGLTASSCCGGIIPHPGRREPSQQSDCLVISKVPGSNRNWICLFSSNTLDSQLLVDIQTLFLSVQRIWRQSAADTKTLTVSTTQNGNNTAEQTRTVLLWESYHERPYPIQSERSVISFGETNKKVDGALFQDRLLAWRELEEEVT